MILPLLAGLASALGLAGLVHAQIEGEPRGIAPVNSAGDFLAQDIMVETTGENSFEARTNGWRDAQRLGWSKLWRQVHGGEGASLSDSRLDGIVSAIEIVDEQIGPKSYKAKVNVYFDRARTGQILGVSGVIRRSAPLLVIPVQVSGGAEMVFEQRTEWQRAWARFRTADSRIDYVRPQGSGAESLIVNAGQLSRRNRQWWRVILDQFGAADVIMPVVELERKYPGGPIIGRFTARAGPDNERLGSFTLIAPNEDKLADMLDKGVERIDRIFTDALASGRLKPDRTLIVEDPVAPEEVTEEPPAEEPEVELSVGAEEAPSDGPENLVPFDQSRPIGVRSGGPPRPSGPPAQSAPQQTSPRPAQPRPQAQPQPQPEQ